MILNNHNKNSLYLYKIIYNLIILKLNFLNPAGKIRRFINSVAPLFTINSANCIENVSQHTDIYHGHQVLLWNTGMKSKKAILISENTRMALNNSKNLVL